MQLSISMIAPKNYLIYVADIPWSAMLLSFLETAACSNEQAIPDYYPTANLFLPNCSA